jgi:hypothetical protein
LIDVETYRNNKHLYVHINSNKFCVYDKELKTFQINKNNINYINGDFQTINKNKTLPHTEKNQAIVEKLLKIYYNLQFYYGNRRDIMSSYFHIKRQYFNNKTLIEYITEDSLINFKLECILQYLKFNIWK